LIIPLILLVAYFLLEDKLGMVSPETVLAMFIIQQFYIWSRTYVKIWILASQYSFYSRFLIKQIEEPQLVLFADDEEWDLASLNKLESD